jgi:GR25 family glycosyltransferase involved in LPS biosynthesis
MALSFLLQGKDVLPQPMTEHNPAGPITSTTPLFGGLDYTLPFPVYYINMDRSEDRHKRTELLFGDLWDLRRIPGVAGSDPEAVLGLLGAENHERVLSYIQRERTGDEAVAWNEIGATLSHLTTIRRAYLENHEMVLIMEDDVSPALM